MGSTSPVLPHGEGFRTLGQCRSLAISEAEDDPEIRKKYRPFLLPEDVEVKDWISELELETVVRIAEADLARTNSRLKVLVLYGSLRPRFVSHIYMTLLIQTVITSTNIR
jgi:arsenic resistance protein ArsH